MFYWDWEDIIAKLLLIPVAIFCVWVVWHLVVQYQECTTKGENCPPPQEQKEETTRGSDFGLHCGYVFGHGFVCGIW